MSDNKMEGNMNHYLQDFLDYLYDQDKSEQTIRAYLADLSAFRRWIEERTELSLIHISEPTRQAEFE